MKKSLILRGLLQIYKYPIFAVAIRSYAIKDLLSKDVLRLKRRDTSKLSNFELFCNIIQNPNLASIFLFRISRKKFLTYFCTFFFSHNRNIEILTPVDKVGGGLIIYHNIGAILRAQSIGDNVTISQGVTVGAGGDWNSNDDNNIPTIGDNVLIATNSIVIGNVKIGNGAVIGAGSVITKDIPENAVVVGNP